MLVQSPKNSHTQAGKTFSRDMLPSEKKITVGLAQAFCFVFGVGLF